MTRLGPGGDTLYSRGYRYRPIPIPEALVDSILAQRVRQVMNSPRPFFASAREAEEAFPQALYIPST